MAELSSGVPRTARVPWLTSDRALPRLQRAGLLAAATVAFFLFVLFAQPLSYLPGYPAVLAAFAVWLLLPGWLPQRALLNDRRATMLERLSVAFLASMAVAALPGLAALRLHWSIEAFATVYAIFAAVAGGASLLWRREEKEAVEQEAGREPATGPLLIVIALALMAILLLPLWAEGHVSRDVGDFEYMRFVNRYATTRRIDPSDSVLSGSTGGFGRLGVDVWLAEQALLSDNAGVQPYDLLMDYLPPITTVLAIAALFTLARGLFRSTRLASLAAVIALGYGAIDISSYECFGRNLFLRSDQDKLVVSLILVPLGLLFVCRFLTQPTARTYMTCLLAAGTTFVVHPMGVEFLALALISVAGLRGLAERSAAPLRRAGLLLLPWMVPLLAALVWSVKVGEPGLQAFGGSLELKTYNAIVRLGSGLVMGNYHLILHPLMLGAILLAPLLWLRAPRSIGSQMLAAVTLSAVLFLLVPILATLLAKAVSEQGVWRLPWLIPVPLTIAYACDQALRRFLPEERPVSASLRARASVALAGVAVAVVVLGGAFVVQEQYARLDDGTYYIRTSSADVLPFTNGSIAWGGIEYAFSHGSHPPQGELRLMRYLERTVPSGSTLLAPPSVHGYVLPMLRDVRLAREKTPEVAAFNNGDLRGEDLRQALRSNGIDFVVVRRGTITENAIRAFAEYDTTTLPAADGAELAVRHAAGVSFPAVAFDANTPEALRDGRFSVPLDANPNDLVVDIQLAVAPSAPVAVDAVAQLEFTVVRVDEPGPPIATIVDVHLRTGGAAGLPMAVSRTLSQSLVPGGEYRWTLSRLAAAPGDTYPADLWLSWLKARYWPASVAKVAGSGYIVYAVGS